MSWFQSTNIASLAKSALKEAQKTIDKALDIREDENSPATSVTGVATDFFASWGVAAKNSAAASKENPISDVSPRKRSLEPSIPEENGDCVNLNSTTTSEDLDNNNPTANPRDHHGFEDVDFDIDTDMPMSNHNFISDIPVDLIVPATSKSSTNLNHSASQSHPFLEESSSTIASTNDDSKFQSLWLLTDSDSFESSIEANSNSVKIESLDEDSTSTIEPDPLSVCSNSNSRHSLLLPQDEDSLTLTSTSTSVPVPVPVPVNVNLVESIPEPEPECESKTEVSTEANSNTLDGGTSSSDLILVDLSEAHSKTDENRSQGQDDLVDEGPKMVEGHYPGCSLNNTLRSRDQSVEEDSSGVQMHEDDEDGLRTPYSHPGQSSSEDIDEPRAEVKGQNDPEPESTSPRHLLDIDNDEKFPESLPTEDKGVHVHDEVNVSVTPEGQGQGQGLLSSPDCKAPSETSSERDSVKSVSSRATSSISVISEEKESSVSASAPVSGPSSPNTDGDARSSPSFEVISIHHCPGKKHMSPSQPHFQHLFDHSGHAVHDLACTHSLSSMSMSIIPQTSQSVSVTSTPQSHSRSNSNTSSSFDRIEDHHRPRSETRGNHAHFVSSTSSSDIEVIPLDSADIIRPRTVSVHEVETQTEPEVVPLTPVPAPPPVNVNVIPAKIAQVLAEKDAEIAQLREEGEKLSKKQFDLSTIIKKLRVKEKDTENVVKGLKGDLATSKMEIERLMKTFVQKEGLEQTQNETIVRIGQEKRKLEGQVDQLRSELEDAKENASSMKSSLEDASIEILELQNSLSTVQRDTAELDTLTKEKSELINQNESLQKELDHLRSLINSNQGLHSTRESELKQQVNSLSQKVHRLENELSDVSSDIADATSPLSLEIEKLQLELKVKDQRFEKRESALVGKIHEMELRLKTSSEHEKSSRDKRTTLEDTIQRLESQIETLMNDRDTLSLQLETELEDKALAVEKLSRVLTLEKENKSLNSQLMNSSNEIQALQNELRAERSSLEAERKKNQNLMEQSSRGHQVNNYGGGGGGGGGGGKQHPHSGENSPVNSIISEASYLEEVFDGNGSVNHNSVTPKYFSESFSSTMNLYDSFQQQLRQREMEVLQFQDEVNKNEKIRKTLNEEIAHLTVQNQELLIHMEQLDEVQASLMDVQKNYNAVLQMYGEKVEEADELRMDLQDVKEMYKLQIEQLLKKS